MARWSLGAWLARQSVRLVVGHTGRMVLLSCPRLSLSRSVCSSGRSRSASTTGCSSAATSANLVLLRQALGLLSVHSRVLFGLEGSASNTSAAYLIWFTSASGAISGVKMNAKLFFMISLATTVACTTIPTGPTLVVMPAPGKPFEVFVADDTVCRQFAERQTGISPQTAATQQIVSGAAVGTAVGAVAEQRSAPPRVILESARG